MYHRQQNKCYPTWCQSVRLTIHSVMIFAASNKFDLCYYGQVNSLRLKSSVALKWQIDTFFFGGGGGNIYFAAGVKVDGRD